MVAKYEQCIHLSTSLCATVHIIPLHTSGIHTPLYITTPPCASLQKCKCAPLHHASLRKSMRTPATCLFIEVYMHPFSTPLFAEVYVHPSTCLFAEVYATHPLRASLQKSTSTPPGFWLVRFFEGPHHSQSDHCASTKLINIKSWFFSPPPLKNGYMQPE